MKRNAVIAVLIVVVVVLSAALVRVENHRYALSTGMCANQSDPRLPPDLSCLATVQTRTGWWCHIWYAVTN